MKTKIMLAVLITALSLPLMADGWFDFTPFPGFPPGGGGGIGYFTIEEGGIFNQIYGEIIQ